MATTGAVIAFRPQVAGSSAAARTTGAVLFFALRDSTGQFTSSGGVPPMRNLRNLKALKPHRSVPLVDANGYVNDAWDNYFQFVDKTFLNVSAGPTLPDVASFITFGQAQSLVNEAVSAALVQQVNANAQSVSSMREVVVAAALPNAAQIPPPKLFADFQIVGATTPEDRGGE